MLPSGIAYPVSDRAVKAIERGMRRLGLDNAELGRRVGKTRQAVGQALKKAGTGACEFLPDMLRAVGEPELLALPGLTEGEMVLLEFVYELARDMPQRQAMRLIEATQRAMGSSEKK